MSVCELRRATLYDTDAVYALICELKQGQFDLQAFSAGYAANLQDPSGRRTGLRSFHRDQGALFLF